MGSIVFTGSSSGLFDKIKFFVTDLTPLVQLFNINISNIEKSKQNETVYDRGTNIIIDMRPTDIKGIIEDGQVGGEAVFLRRYCQLSFRILSDEHSANDVLEVLALSFGKKDVIDYFCRNDIALSGVYNVDDGTLLINNQRVQPGMILRTMIHTASRLVYID